MKQVLVVAYYFPPLGLSGVQRIGGFVRHLPEYGWKPTVLTAKPAGYFAHDDSLWAPIQEAGIRVIQTRSLDPTRFFRAGSTVKLPRESKRKVLASISNWVFVPDNKLGWMPFAVRAGLREASFQAFNAIFSSAPPYTGHLVGCKIARRLGLPLIVDFRDDWVGNPRHIYPTPLHRRLHVRQERRVLQNASAVSTINHPILDGLQARHKRLNIPGHVISHGYEEQRASSVIRKNHKNKLCLVYTGVFYDAQTPEYFLRGLREFLIQNPDMLERVTAIFAGLVPDYFARLVRSLKLEQVVQYVGYLEHSSVVALQQRADILWMTIGSRPGASQISTGKLFEYMGTRKPILALVPPGAASDTLHRYRAAYIVSPEDINQATQALNRIRNDWRNQCFPEPDEAFVSKLSRKHLTQRLSDALNTAVQG
ncbi:MAG: glycosyltransferase family 4 protein [Rhodothermaceae bacterium]|nr:glycosyltransferase family 4 protein [Rhodothermaceae bacterium]MXX59234.1 glycosyltransferase family 4 protein [Rhodothermaceae bacterium]MYD20355.1 glycosyltransferase family 4 protein [Rhodothermaceae bacterium]MYD56689.1 glycosyltransferase family 4 protein [Rhodothermaceae bacterium]MYJ56222.1 glycosyltransferase family 4 protein [Rhodothermaceae bacterium]